MKFTNKNQAHEFYADILTDAKKTDDEPGVMAELGRCDLFFLLVRLLNRLDVDKDWLFERCQEVQNEPNGFLDLWAREHYKSTIITFGLTIQDILVDPEITFGLFSITRPGGKSFLIQIKSELEGNTLLKQLYPDVLWQNPVTEAPMWSLDNGIVVKRKGNPKEATVEAWGLVEGIPTGKHYKIKLYDDVINEKYVTNTDMIKRAIASWELSLNLGSQQPTKRYGTQTDIDRYAGTRYHANDPYATIIKRGAAIPRIHTATKDGKIDGEPVLMSRETLQAKRKKMGPYTYGCQMMQDPTADEAQGFKHEWLRFWEPHDLQLLNLYLSCDPANGKKKENDYTVMAIVGLGSDKNYYLVDMLRDRLNLVERTKKLIAFHKKYSPLGTGYERYGKDSDIQHIEYVMDQINYRFSITEVAGSMPKNDRIRRLIPAFSEGRFFIPKSIMYIDNELKIRDMTKELIEDELDTFPVSLHDDMLDCISRVMSPEMSIQFPLLIDNYQHNQSVKQVSVFCE